jgi:hypothetical protein
VEDVEMAMRTRTWALFTTIAAAGGCFGAEPIDSEEPALEQAPTADGVEHDWIRPVPRDDHSSPSASLDPLVAEDATAIYDIRRPDGAIATGTRVLVDAPIVKVTGAAATQFWMQEADASGYCDVADDVAYRAITVAPITVDEEPLAEDLRALLAPGQRVRVEGTVAEIDGNTTLIDAVVTRIGEPTLPYDAHCERDGGFVDEAFESVYVLTAGTTEGFDAPDEDGVWQLGTCFGAAVLVDDLIQPHETWSPSWQWVRGILVQSGERHLLEPRVPSDVDVEGGDACL